MGCSHPRETRCRDDLGAKGVSHNRALKVHGRRADGSGINRRLPRDRREQAAAIARCPCHLVALLLSVNQVKVINDSASLPALYGLIRAVAQQQLAATCAGYTVARRVGHELDLLQPRLGRSGEAAHVAHKFPGAVSNCFAIQTREIHVAAGTGVALHPHEGSDEEVLKGAELAMGHGKQLDAARSFSTQRQ